MGDERFGHRGGFHLEITSIEEFTVFCALIRGDDVIDPIKLRALGEKLHVGATELAAANAANQPPSAQ